MGNPVTLYFFRAYCQKRGLNFSWGDLNSIETGMVVILLSFLYNNDNLTLKLYQEKRRYPHEGWLFIGRFKVRSVPGISVSYKASKKSIKSIMSIMQDY